MDSHEINFPEAEWQSFHDSVFECGFCKCHLDFHSQSLIQPLLLMFGTLKGKKLFVKKRDREGGGGRILKKNFDLRRKYAFLYECESK